MNREVVTNTANKAANLRIGGPGTPGFKEKAPGPATDKLRGGSTIFMKGRPALEQRQAEDGSTVDLMATVASGDDGSKQELGVIRLEDGSYAVATTNEEGESVLTQLDEFGNKPHSFNLAGSEVNINFRPLQEDLSIIPGTFGNPGELEVTINN